MDTSIFKIEQKISRQVMSRIINEHKVCTRLLQHMIAQSHERVVGINIAIHNQKWVRRQPLECLDDAACRLQRFILVRETLMETPQ